jgi:hypothetical protein
VPVADAPARNVIMVDDIDLAALYAIPRIRYYFRYRLHRKDFHELRVRDRVAGHYAAKALYGRLTPQGRVDRSSGFNGDVAALFVPVEARTPHDVSLLLTHISPADILLPTGRRNWGAIYGAAEARIRETLLPP